eukprot:Gb_26055 [translate_table: standard]
MPIEGSLRRRNGGPSAPKSSAHSAALEQLKNLRQRGGRRVDGFELKMEDKIYDSVAEDDYALLVAKRREAVKDFVVDDGGFGYNDVGEEDDWDADALPSSSEEEEGSSRKKKQAKDPSEIRKKKDANASKKATSLAAAAALMGKQRVSSMFTSSLLRKNKEEKGAQKGFSTDSILEDVLAEITPDEADREKRRRRAGSKGAALQANFYPTNIQNPPQAFAGNRLDFSPDELPLEHGISLEGGQKTKAIATGYESVSCTAIGSEISRPAMEENHISIELPNDNAENQSSKDDGMDATKAVPSDNDRGILADGELKAKAENHDKEKYVLNAKIGCENNLFSKATADWQAVWQDGEEKEAKSEQTVGNKLVSEDENSLPLESDGSLLFYLIDAYEEAYGAHPGTIYLFGKVKVRNTYVSCCVVVQNMQRCVFAIPTPSVFPDKVITELDQVAKEVPAEQSTLRKKLQEMASGLKRELSQRLMDLNVTNFSMLPVKVCQFKFM